MPLHTITAPARGPSQGLLVLLLLAAGLAWLGPDIGRRGQPQLHGRRAHSRSCNQDGVDHHARWRAPLGRPVCAAGYAAQRSDGFPVLLEYLPYRKTEARSDRFGFYSYFVRAATSSRASTSAARGRAKAS